jgi:hypothetical protein
MNILIILLPLVVLLGMFALSAKLAAFLLRRIKLSWGMSFLYALIVILASAAVRMVLAALGAPISGATAGSVGLIAQLAIGTGFFAYRAKSESGAAAGWRGGLLLTVVALLIVIVVAMLLMVLATAMHMQLTR